MPDDDFEEFESGLTYVIGSRCTAEGDQTNITCRICERTSHNMADVMNVYCGHCKMWHRDSSAIWFYTIYDHPRDAPDKWVLRRHALVFNPALDRPQDIVETYGFTADSREALVPLIPGGAVQVGPVLGDDPVIAEVWMI